MERMLISIHSNNHHRTPPNTSTRIYLLVFVEGEGFCRVEGREDWGEEGCSCGGSKLLEGSGYEVELWKGSS
jgi:hypothetical protein